MGGNAIELMRRLWRNPVARRAIVYTGLIAMLVALPNPSFIAAQRRTKESAAEHALIGEALSYIKARTGDERIEADYLIEHLRSAGIANPLSPGIPPRVETNGSEVNFVFADDPRSKEPTDFVLTWHLADSMRPSEWYLVIGNRHVKVSRP